VDRLKRKLDRLEGIGYKGYKQLKGAYCFKKYDICIDHIQSDPFAPPSRVRIKVPQKVAGFPAHVYSNRNREVASKDFIARKLKKTITKYSKGGRGTGKSGFISIAPAGQEIIERTSVFINGEYVEARITVALPAYGRRIAGQQAKEMFFKEIPLVIENALLYKNIDETELMKHIKTMEDADYIRVNLKKSGMVAFIADGSILPRKSGVDAAPMTGNFVVPFSSPDTMRIEMTPPNRGKITGMGVREGVTLIVGGGFHGKSTLLNAIEMGVYNHIPGDGREFAVTVPCGLKIRAEGGRRVEKVDISSFIDNLPFGRSTEDFSTENASGSTSQAANIIEALEIGADLLMLDEDTSATNFMIRDHRMQELVSKEKEPITPFIDKVKSLHTNLGVSTILVMGGSGDYFDVADSVVSMQDYKPYDVTGKARDIANRYKSERRREGGNTFGNILQRIPLSKSLDPSRGRKNVKIRVKSMHSILFGAELIDLSVLEQLVDYGQTRAIADTIYYAKRYMNGETTLREVIDRVFLDIENNGLDTVSPFINGEYVHFRKCEFSAAINRLRSLVVR
jgi:predicted ABC-class ATPase